MSRLGEQCDGMSEEAANRFYESEASQDDQSNQQAALACVTAMTVVVGVTVTMAAVAAATAVAAVTAMAGVTAVANVTAVTAGGMAAVSVV